MSATSPPVAFLCGADFRHLPDVIALLESIEQTSDDVGAVHRLEPELQVADSVVAVEVVLAESRHAEDRPLEVRLPDAAGVVGGVFEHVADELQQRAHHPPAQRDRFPLLADAHLDESHEPGDPVLLHRLDDVIASDGEQVVGRALSLAEDARHRVRSPYCVGDALTGVGVPFDDGQPVVFELKLPGRARVDDDLVSAVYRLLTEREPRTAGCTEDGDSELIEIPVNLRFESLFEASATVRT